MEKIPDGASGGNLRSDSWRKSPEEFWDEIPGLIPKFYGQRINCY